MTNRGTPKPGNRKKSFDGGTFATEAAQLCLHWGKIRHKMLHCTKCLRDLEEEFIHNKSTLSQGVKTVTQSQRISFVEPSFKQFKKKTTFL